MSRVLDRKARVATWLATRASRDTGIVDRLCRRILHRVLELPPDDDFLRDEWVDSDTGFDPDELDRYQRGELKDAAAKSRD